MHGVKLEGLEMALPDCQKEITTWSLDQLAEAVRQDGDDACEALDELESCWLVLRLIHRCDRPLKHAP